jgi:hypothetical protein
LDGVAVGEFVLLAVVAVLGAGMMVLAGWIVLASSP